MSTRGNCSRERRKAQQGSKPANVGIVSSGEVCSTELVQGKTSSAGTNSSRRARINIDITINHRQVLLFEASPTSLLTFSSRTVLVDRYFSQHISRHRSSSFASARTSHSRNKRQRAALQRDHRSVGICQMVCQSSSVDCGGGLPAFQSQHASGC